MRGTRVHHRRSGAPPIQRPKNPERQRQFYSDYRNFKAGFEDTLIETACGLHNLRSNFPIEAWLKAA